MKSLFFLSLLFIPTLLLAENTLPSPTTEAAVFPVVDLASPGAEKRAAPSHENQVTVSPAAGGTGLDVAVAAGPAGFPGVSFTPAGEYFDLSQSGFVEVRVTNTGTSVIAPSLRVDSPDGSASGPSYLKPGETGKARAYFASPGKAANPVDPAKITRILVFIGKNEKDARSFRLESLTASGHPGEKAPVNPNTVRVKPKDGVTFAPSAPFNAAKQTQARNGAKVSPTAAKALSVTFSGQEKEDVVIRPVQGFWDLGDFLEVTVQVKNTGTQPLSLQGQLLSQGSPSDFGKTAEPIAPGSTADLTISFIPSTPFKILSDPAQEVLEGKKSWGVEETPGARFFSHQTSGLLLSSQAPGGASFEILGVTAGLPEGDPRPAWLGQRPPVEGEWVQTFEDTFGGDSLDTAKWNVHSENWWDKRLGFSKQNVLLGDGRARLRLEKRDGFHNDDPNGKPTTFATGWLDTYAKWNQTYGYYEVRIRMPKAPSMFPAFWLMPDRGPADWPKHRRTDTKDGGMEFDVFEGQSIWGPYRTTFGMHWDNYGKYHKSAGTTAHYNRPDPEGYLTLGLLWLPGHVSVYSNGQLQGSWDSPRVGSVPHYVMFDLLSGGFEYEPLDPATLPADLEIDYIRVWQRRDLLEKK